MEKRPTGGIGCRCQGQECRWLHSRVAPAPVHGIVVATDMGVDMYTQVAANEPEDIFHHTKADSKTFIDGPMSLPPIVEKHPKVDVFGVAAAPNGYSLPFIAFKGTDNTADWATNLDYRASEQNIQGLLSHLHPRTCMSPAVFIHSLVCIQFHITMMPCVFHTVSGGQEVVVHKGFFEAVEGAVDELMKQVEHVMKESDSKSILITGHSLGMWATVHLHSTGRS